jgi:hypothetical protein
MGREPTPAERDMLINTGLDLMVAGVGRLQVIELLLAAAASIGVQESDESTCSNGASLCRSCFVDKADEVYGKMTIVDEWRQHAH